MRVPVHKLLHYARGNVPYIEVVLFTFYLRMEHHLQKHVAKLLAQRAHIVAVDGVYHLVAFFYERRFNAFVCLLPVPRAAGGTSEPVYDVNKRVYAIA